MDRRHAIAAVVCPVACYAAGAFIALDADITQWHESSRAALILLSLIAWGMSCAAIADHDADRKSRRDAKATGEQA